MTDRTRTRWGVAAALTCSLLLPGCIADGDAPPPEPEPEASATLPPRIRLGDVSVSGSALAQRAGLYMCGDSIVASAPAGGIEADSFVVFEPATGQGDITEVQLPRRMRPNARWLLTTQCVAEGGEPIISVAYQEMPLTPTGGAGIRAAYSLDGERLWMRDDLNQAGAVVEDVLVLGAAPEHPETAVDLRTGDTVATFDPAVQSRTVVASDRMVVRGLSGPPLLTTLTGEEIATLRQAASFTADGDLLFASTPAALPDPTAPTEPAEPTGDQNGAGLTDASPSPSPTQHTAPGDRSGLPQGEVRAYSLRTGEPQWSLRLAPDPLGMPTVEPRTGIVVIVDVNGVAHGISPVTGRREWRTPTELENPRVTAANGIVLFDNVDEPFQKLVDARTGLPLPEPREPIADLQRLGALQIVDGLPTVASPAQLRRPPTTEDPPG
ncbi:MAG TPA: PQQ-binding-like beta-propeller repeat protein [Nocardioidaceae bacterium]|nr:PQQ-binding-like beta-propeller repeat protein [Nocardioidaceae bacterium]